MWHDRRRRWHLIVVLLTCAVGTVASYAATAVYPWFAMPAREAQAIEQQWSTLRASMQPLDASRHGDGRDLERAGALARAITPELGEALEGATLRRDTLPVRGLEALAALDAWRRSQHPTAAGLCAQNPHTLGLHDLGKLAVAVAKGEGDVELVESALYLAEALRQRGGVVPMSVGLNLATLAASSGVATRRQLERYRPTVEQVREALRRERFCLAEMIATSFPTKLERFERVRHQRLGNDQVPPGRLIDLQRERLVVIDEVGRELVALREVGDDGHALVAELEASDERERPKSLTLDAISTFDRAEHARGALELIADYDRELAKASTP